MSCIDKKMEKEINFFKAALTKSGPIKEIKDNLVFLDYLSDHKDRVRLALNSYFLSVCSKRISPWQILTSKFNGLSITFFSLVEIEDLDIKAATYYTGTEDIKGDDLLIFLDKKVKDKKEIKKVKYKGSELSFFLHTTEYSIKGFENVNKKNIPLYHFSHDQAGTKAEIPDLMGYIRSSILNKKDLSFDIKKIEEYVAKENTEKIISLFKEAA